MERAKMQERVSLFVNRKKELAELADTKEHVVMVGYRRMGKTHLIVKSLLDGWDRRTVPVYLDMLYFSSWAEFAERLVEEFLAAYDKGKGGELPALFARVSTSLSSALSSVKEIEAKFGLQGVKFFSLRIAFKEKKKTEFELLKGALEFIDGFAAKKHVGVIIALDEVQSIKEYGNMGQGLAILRGELQFTKNIRLILSGSMPSFINSNILKKTKPFWKQLKTMRVEPFDKTGIAEASRLLGVQLANVDEVFTCTKGVPDYVVKVLREIKKGAKVEEAFETAVRNEELFFSTLVSSLSKTEHIALKHIAGGGGYAEVEKALGYPPTAVLSNLIIQGLLKKLERGAYEIVDPGLEYYLKH